MRKTLLSLLLILLTLSLSAAEYKELPLEDKISDPDLSFAVTFDKKGVNADKAVGNANSTTMADASLLLRGLIGFDSVGAFKPEPGEDLKFDAVNNANPHEGTLMLWVCGLDYDPGQELTEGKKRGNIALAHLWFQQAERHIEFQLYEYGDTVYFDWRNSEPPHGWGSIGRLQVSRVGLKQGQWHQIVTTWQKNQIHIYLNGEKVDSATLPAKFSKTSDLTCEEGVSYIGIKSRFYEDKHDRAVGIDDFKIYSRALSALEIANQYKKLLSGSAAAEIKAYDIQLNGVNIGWDDPIDRLEAEFDFSGLKAESKKALQDGKLPMQYQLLDPAGKTVASGNWTFQNIQETRILKPVDQKGTYTLKTQFGGENVTVSVERPDYSWAGNQIGNEDEVPEIWKDFAVKDRDVTLWNRRYRFGAGPLPEAIDAYGEALLLEPPRLLIDQQTIRWQAGSTSRNNCSVTFTGTGQADNFSLEYATTVEYDGLIKFNFSIQGEPEIRSMKLLWRCRPELCTYLMTPHAQLEGGPQFAFPYPDSDSRHRQLWFVSEGKGGFAYSMRNDANWIYDPKEPVFFADQTSGACEVRMITSNIKIPADTPYEALFIATPTRPLPELNRMICFDGGRGTYGFLNAGGDGGMTGVFNMEPHEEGFARKVATAKPYSLTVYGAADALTTLEPEAVYLRKYWEIPGAYSYKMPYHRPLPDGSTEKVHGFSLSACNTGIINDFYLKGIKKMFEHPYGDRIWQIYYDLCGNNLCRNALHGCRYNDKFGREVSTYSLLSKRKLVERTVRYCHAHKRTVMLHGQRDYFPMLQGLADYWFPGEQHSSLLRRNPYGYTDEIPDALYRSEYNRNVLGIGVIHLPSLGQASLENFREPAYPYTVAMLMMLQLHDIETAMSWAARLPTHKLWNALEKYQFEKPDLKVHLYYQQNEIRSSNPEVRITWYETPENHRVLILGNKDVFPQETTVDLTLIEGGSFTAREEYEGFDVPVESGKFNITIPSRSLRIVAFPPKTFYPYQDDFHRSWGFWKAPDSDAEYRHERDFGRTDRFSMRLVNREKGGVLTKGVPVLPGKQYTASIWCKSPAEVSVSISFQGQKDGKFLGLTPQKTTSKILAEQWQQIQHSFTIPDQGKWAECNNLLITIGSDPQSNVAFDDFLLIELDPK
ncbi:MAG: glycoside hydrolase domain-containing protein [Lentisphaeria bacterium]